MGPGIILTQSNYVCPSIESIIVLEGDQAYYGKMLQCKIYNGFDHLHDFILFKTSIFFNLKTLCLKSITYVFKTIYRTRRQENYKNIFQ